MTRTIIAEFNSRRDAETAIEHLVQEHGIDRKAVMVTSASEQNTAGVEPAGADMEGGSEKRGTEGKPALEGRVTVAVQVEDATADKVTTTFEAYGAHSAGS